MTPQTRVKERAEEQASAMTADQQAMIRMVANDLHRLNQSVMKAVDAGVSVELVRPPSRRRRQLGRPVDPGHRDPGQVKKLYGPFGASKPRVGSRAMIAGFGGSFTRSLRGIFVFRG